MVSYEAIRLWCNKFGATYARRLKRKHQGYGDTFFIDEVFIKINGERHYLWSLQSIQSGSTFSICQELPVFSREILCVLGKCYSLREYYLALLEVLNG